MDAPPPYPGGGGFQARLSKVTLSWRSDVWNSQPSSEIHDLLSCFIQAPPPPYSETDPSAPYPTKDQGFQVPGGGHLLQGQGQPGHPRPGHAQGQVRSCHVSCDEDTYNALTLTLKIMVVCGGWDGDRALESVEMFSPRTGQWSPLPNMLGVV